MTTTKLDKLNNPYHPDTCQRCNTALPDDRTYCEDCEALETLEQREPYDYHQYENRRS